MFISQIKFGRFVRVYVIAGKCLAKSVEEQRPHSTKFSAWVWNVGQVGKVCFALCQSSECCNIMWVEYITILWLFLELRLFLELLCLWCVFWRIRCLYFKTDTFIFSLIGRPTLYSYIHNNIMYVSCVRVYNYNSVIDVYR